MSAFDLAGDHDSASLIDQARMNPLDLSQPAGFFTGMGTGLVTGLGRLAADTQRTAGLALGAVAGSFDMLTGDAIKAQDKVFEHLVTPADRLSRHLAPKAEEIGMAGQILHGLVKIGGEAVAFGPGGVLVNETVGGTLDALDKGVDLQTAAKVGGVQGAAMTAGVVAPMTLGSTGLGMNLLYGAGINLAQGVFQRGATSEIYARAGRPDLAMQFQALDKEAMAVDAIIGAAFAGGGRALQLRGEKAKADAMAEYRAKIADMLKPSDIDAALTKNEQLKIERPGFGLPADLASRDAHVANLTGAIDDLIEGRPVTMRQEVGDFIPDPAAAKVQQDVAAVLAPEVAPKVGVDATKVDAWDAYENRVIPDGWYVHGRASRQDLETGQVIQMTKDWDVADQYAHKNGSKWMIRPSEDATVLDLSSRSTPDMDRVVAAAIDDFENGDRDFSDIVSDIEGSLGREATTSDVEKAIRDSFSPDDIVNSAQAYDNWTWAGWLTTRLGVDFVHVPDGAVAMGDYAVQGVKVPSSRPVNGSPDLPLVKASDGSGVDATAQSETIYLDDFLSSRHDDSGLPLTSAELPIPPELRSKILTAYNAASKDSETKLGRIEDSENISAKTEAFRAMAEAEGYAVGGNYKYLTISKNDVVLRVRLSDHANVNKSVHFGESQINIAPSDGGNPVDTFASALYIMRHAAVDADGEVVIARNAPTAVNERLGFVVTHQGEHASTAAGSDAKTTGTIPEAQALRPDAVIPMDDADSIATVAEAQGIITDLETAAREQETGLRAAVACFLRAA